MLEWGSDPASRLFGVEQLTSANGQLTDRSFTDMSLMDIIYVRAGASSGFDRCKRLRLR